jgi:hypothetical protein
MTRPLPMYAERAVLDLLGLDAALHVVELAHVEIAAVRLQVPEERIGDGLQDPLQRDHTPALAELCDVTGERLGLGDAAVFGQHAASGLLALQQQGVAVAVLHEHQ